MTKSYWQFRSESLLARALSSVGREEIATRLQVG